MKRIIFIFAILAIASILPAQAQESPYLDFQNREIKALSSGDIESLLEGKGMGFALAAELNGLPGPKHVLDMSSDLGLTAEQLQRTRSIYDAMLDSAVATGKLVVEKERELDTLFANGDATVDSVRYLSAEIGKLNGQLRAGHLSAHIEMIHVLSHDQRLKYQALRGYTGGATHDHSRAH
ncbi:MAG: hypothetical protein HKN43_13810 [Rhodothermales bacterium]|nr:hypothetical protein [Rhodothermales bacterium]